VVERSKKVRGDNTVDEADTFPPGTSLRRDQGASPPPEVDDAEDTLPPTPRTKLEREAAPRSDTAPPRKAVPPAYSDDFENAPPTVRGPAPQIARKTPLPRVPAIETRAPRVAPIERKTPPPKPDTIDSGPWVGRLRRTGTQGQAPPSQPRAVTLPAPDQAPKSTPPSHERAVVLPVPAQASKQAAPLSVGGQLVAARLASAIEQVRAPAPRATSRFVLHESEQVEPGIGSMKREFALVAAFVVMAAVLAHTFRKIDTGWISIESTPHASAPPKLVAMSWKEQIFVAQPARQVPPQAPRVSVVPPPVPVRTPVPRVKPPEATRLTYNYYYEDRPALRARLDASPVKKTELDKK
jgi:hypothetical protein